MPGRAQHSKGKHTPHSKKRKVRQSHPSKVSQQQSVSPTSEATAPCQATGYPIARVAAKIAVGKRLDEIPNVVTPPPTAVKCPNLLIELRRVGILAGVMLVILLALVLVL